MTESHEEQASEIAALRTSVHDLADVLAEEDFDQRRAGDALHRAYLLTELADRRDRALLNLLRVLRKELDEGALVESRRYYAARLLKAVDQL